MAIALEFIDLVIPVALIRDRYPGGWEACVRDHESLIGRRVWFDEFLWRDGALTVADIEARVSGWAVLGFRPTTARGPERRWDDLCVINADTRGSILACPWIEIDAAAKVAWYTGTARGEWVGPTRRAATRRDAYAGPVSVPPG
jgi:hypothetical protein